MRYLWPGTTLESLEEIVLVRAGELYFSLACVCFGQVFPYEEIIDA